jgi:broad specificity phosphatase PhoE
MAIVRRNSNPQMRMMMALKPALANVYVLRHGSTDRNKGGVGQDQIRGHADIPMTAGGENEVRVTAYQIADRPISVIHASDLIRSVSTAAILAEENVNGPVVVGSTKLRSWDMGAAMEGLVTTPEVVAKIVGWVTDDSTVPPGGESFRAFASRLLGHVGPLFADALASGETIAIVTHGRCAQVIEFWCAAGCDEDCMHTEFAEWLAEEPDTVPPGGGVHYKHDGLGWMGSVIPTGKASIGTQIADGIKVRPANAMAVKSGVMVS